MIIKIKDFKFKTIIGVYEWEKTFEREIIINATIETDNDISCFSDKLEDTIDYAEIINKISVFLSSNQFNLIEKMAQKILELIMKDERVKKCTVEIDKMHVIENVNSTSITLTQERNG